MDVFDKLLEEDEFVQRQYELGFQEGFLEGKIEGEIEGRIEAHRTALVDIVKGKFLHSSALA